MTADGCGVSFGGDVDDLELGDNGRDLTEAEDIKKRWQEYTEEPYKKDLHDPDNHDGALTLSSQSAQAWLCSGMEWESLSQASPYLLG